MSRTLSLVVLAASVLLAVVGAGALADPAAADNSGYAFTAGAVGTRQNNLLSPPFDRSLTGAHIRFAVGAWGQPHCRMAGGLRTHSLRGSHDERSRLHLAHQWARRG